VNFAKALRSALRPGWWPALARGVVPTIEHGPALAGIEPRAVIDVGANKGQFSSFAAARWPAAEIHAFEPLPGPAAKYRAVLGSRARLHDCALGSAAGVVEMHVASRADSSSLLALGDEQKAIFGMDEVGTLAVAVRRLDEIFAPGTLPAPALLKIDVQGFEYEVIEGIGALADAIEWVFVETSFVELYRGQRLHEEVADLLSRLGYDLAIEHNPTHDERGRKVQADVLFARRRG